MTRSDSWTRVGSVPPAALRDATIQLHWAAQVLAAAGQTFAETQDDDSHLAMRWDADRGELVSTPFGGAYPFRVALRIQDITLQLLDRTAEPLGSLPLAGETMADAYEWLQTGLANYMGRLTQIDKPEWEMPEHAVGRGEPFSADMDVELSTLACLYESAAGILTPLADGHAHGSPVRCWPHHFDIATLLTVASDESGNATKTVGVGMAPMGGGYEGWYWYVSPWPFPDAGGLPELEGPGAWHTEGWVGAVLTGEDVVEADDAFREAVVTKFVDYSVSTSVEVLNRTTSP